MKNNNWQESYDQLWKASLFIALYSNYWTKPHLD